MPPVAEGQTLLDQDANAGVVSINGGVFDHRILTHEQKDKTPVLLVYGRADNVVPPISGRPFAKYIDEKNWEVGELHIEKGHLDDVFRTITQSQQAIS